jgi:hypothetical protein
MKIWRDIRSALALNGSDETRLKIGQPDFIRPMVGAHLNVMRAVIVRAIHQDAANTGFARLAKGDFLRPLQAP